MPEPTQETEPQFFAIGKAKLVTMSVCTFGLYEFYWFFENWRIVCRRCGLTSLWNPALRGFFAVLFCYPLFKRVDRSARAEGLPSIHPGWTAIAWLLIHFTWRLPDPYWIVSVFSFLPILRVQAVVQHLNAKLAPAAGLNRRLSPVNWVVCVLGSLLLLAAIAGTLDPVDDGGLTLETLYGQVDVAAG